MDLHNNRCCVFQPFDKGPYDKRFEDTIAPAIIAGGLDPYRVDRDDGVVIPMETLHEEIRSSSLCLADISNRNPNVMYELGFAIASGKDVVIICSANQSEKFPFDIQHRGIIQYASDSASDFEKLKNDISNKVKALIKKQETTQAVASVSPVRSTHGLEQNEIAALALILANWDGRTGASAYTIKSDMEKAGYTRVACQLAIIRLGRLGFVEAYEESSSDETWTAYRLLPSGEDWLLTNANQLQMTIHNNTTSPRRNTSEVSIFNVSSDEDFPF